MYEKITNEETNLESFFSLINLKLLLFSAVPVRDTELKTRPEMVTQTLLLQCNNSYSCHGDCMKVK